jgi:hypothetical protein
MPDREQQQQRDSSNCSWVCCVTWMWLARIAPFARKHASGTKHSCGAGCVGCKGERRASPAMVWVWLKRATRRDPSYSRSCREVVGLLSSAPAHSPGGVLAVVAAGGWLLLPAPGAAAAAAAELLLLAPRVRPEPEKATYLHGGGSKTGGSIRVAKSGSIPGGGTVEGQ